MFEWFRSRRGALRGQVAIGAGVVVTAVAAGPPAAIEPADGVLSIPAASGLSPIASRRLATGLTSPVGLAFAPGDATRLFVVEQIGRIWIVDVPTATVSAQPFLDISSQVRAVAEAGLLSVAFDPDHATNGFFYIAYNEQPGGDMHIARYGLTGDPDVADPNSEVILKSITDYLGHNGGQLQFGPDGLLYFGSGDGSTNALNDPDNNAQNLLSLHGKILRLDPDNPPGYIPASNPYVGDPNALDEIWSRGLRNPWRFGFDPLTGDLYIADVGKNAFEEIDFEAAGAGGTLNYGWKCMEATACTGFGGCTCFDASLTPPILEVAHGNPEINCAIIGGYVYRGSAAPALDGRYFHSDYCAAALRSFRFTPTGVAGGVVSDEADHTADLNPQTSIPFITSFGQDPGGELYFCSHAGSVWQIVPLAEADCDGDGTSDLAELVAGTALDCNNNGIPDDCDVAGGFSDDCDGNGIPDECEFSTTVSFTAPVVTPFGNGSPLSHTIVAPPAARNDVRVDVTAFADVGSDHEWIDVRLNGVIVGTVFQRDGINCPLGPEVGQVRVDTAVFNQILGGGDLTLELVSSVNVAAASCTPPAFASATLHYEVIDPAADTNGDGVPDVCACVADLDGDGVVNITDLLDLLAAWGQSPGGPPDFDGGGVGITDLLLLLAAWGPCP